MLSLTTPEEHTKHLLDAPTTDWDGLQHNLFDETKVECIDYLDTIIERAARLRAYIEHRRTQSHDRSVKAANSMGAKVRKVLGYTYPKANEISF